MRAGLARVGLIFSLTAMGAVGHGCSTPCVLNTQCSSDELCRVGVCLKACTAYYDCADGQACYEGACEVPPEGFCASQVPSAEGIPSVLCAPEDLPDMDPSTRPDARVDMGADMGADMGGAMGPDMGADMGGAMGPDMGADMGGAMGPDMGADMGGAMGLDMGPDMGGAMGPDMDPDMDPDMGGAMGGAAGTQAGAEPPPAGAEVTYPPSETPWLHTQGAALYQQGSTARWVGRGVNIHDTRSCDACAWTPPNVGEVLRRVDEATDVWGATLLRLNLESYAVANGRLQSLGVTEDQAYLSDLVRVVRHIGTKRGVYVVISPWRDPTLSAEGWPTAQTRSSLALLARTFYDAPFVIFAVSNEPRQNLDGAQDAAAWQAMNDAVEAIRAEERALGPNRHIVAVQGTRDLGRDLSYYLEHPITADGGANVLYEAHIFNPRADLSRLLTTPAQTLPTLVGAFGPAATPQRAMSLEDAQALMAEAERQGGSWAAWTFHMRCQTTALLVDASALGCGAGMPLQPTEWGQAVLSQLQAAP